MELRGYKHNSEIPLEGFEVTWPETFIDEPSRQYELLKDKYIGKQPPPIPLPSNNRDLWKQHKFSILARDEKQYREIGPQVAGNEHVEMKVLAHKLALLLRTPPSSGGLSNALDHMWGFLKKLASSQDKDLAIAAREAGSKDYLRKIREGANIHGVSYILESTALYELDCWHE